MSLPFKKTWESHSGDADKDEYPMDDNVQGTHLDGTIDAVGGKGVAIVGCADGELPESESTGDLTVRGR